jgi:hypothetical protein
MTSNRLSLVLLVALLLGAIGLRPGAAVAEGPGPVSPSDATTGVAAGFTYQGQLKAAGEPFTGVCAFQFGLFNAVSGGQQVGATQTVNGVTVTEGLFTVTLNQTNQFSSTAFNGQARWLKIDVKCGADAGFTTLSPRQPLTPAPYALSLPGMRVEPNAESPNIIGGHISNTVTSGVVGATISGGGEWVGDTDFTNKVTDMYGAIGGGRNNRAGDSSGTFIDAPFATVGGGASNFASGSEATIAGGAKNDASGFAATVGGGEVNEAVGEAATVSGGFDNHALGYAAVVGGGRANHANGAYSTIPGGYLNSATLTYTLAAGRRAKAIHQGSFVWADSANADFASSGNDQFLIRASGGVGIGTSLPFNQLHVLKSIGASASPVNHVVQFENTAGSSPDILALRATNVTTPGTDVNYITFFDSASDTLGAIQGNGTGGVVMAGPGNDFAEYLPKQSPTEQLSAGDIVGVHSGQLSRVTAGADQILVIPTSPIVAGNAPGTDAERSSLALAAFVGQADVRVLGEVAAGSFIVPSGKNDGLGLAVTPENLTAEQAAQIAGQALESVAGAGPHTVRITVGLPRDKVLASLFDRIQTLEQQAAPQAQATAPSQLSLNTVLPWLLLSGVLFFNLGLFIGRRRA